MMNRTLPELYEYLTAAIKADQAVNAKAMEVNERYNAIVQEREATWAEKHSTNEEINNLLDEINEVVMGQV